ncbi:uncharacterized protein HMPREF1541_05384 [Cyphellophora europaea CBS 101466]|uniref:Uncharacterized protein n=1 Tax=Cyphellophora europaea (strain CBS 101466) TaxID=1220924 RepID=W2RRL1_CYPE1|nr:uncharacterized protein HMPREF1541_05384 [Cyphellophora europaea CBS 101466]ETN39161.1 hypothetical protein HMPREF1541_05384 [Cyphellophora europaea CBS 101466]
MANEETSYFFPPKWHFQLGGPIALGSIIEDSRKPQASLNYGEPNPQPLPKPTVDITKPNFKATIVIDTSVSTGIGTSLLQIFGFGVDLDAERGRRRVYEIEAELLRTQEIEPEQDWVKKAFANEEVQRVLRRNKFRIDLYMITGIMSATKASVCTDSDRRVLFNAKVGVDLTVSTGGTAPLGVNVKGGTKVERSTKASFGASDFILGYRLRKITYVKFSRKIRMEDVLKGTVLDGDAKAPKPETVDDSEFLRLENEDIGADEFGLNSAIAQTEGNEHTLAFGIPGDEE